MRVQTPTQMLRAERRRIREGLQDVDNRLSQIYGGKYKPIANQYHMANKIMVHKKHKSGKKSKQLDKGDGG